MNKISRFLHYALELIWFAAALFCIFIAIKEGINAHVRQTLIFAGLTIGALFFFISRRNQRINKKQ